MWRLRPSMGSTLYFTLRYPMLFNTIAVVLAYLSWGSWQTQTVNILDSIVNNNAEEASFAYKHICRGEKSCTIRVIPRLMNAVSGFTAVAS